MSVIINAISGYGDVMFMEPIYRYFWRRDGTKPTVIIHDHQMFFKDYIDSANFVPASHYPQLRDDAVMRGGYLPLRWANQIHRGYGLHDHHDCENVMLDKYRLLGLSEDLWKTLEINFDWSKAGQLTLELNMNKNQNYVLFNEHSQAGDTDIRIPGLQAYKHYMNAVGGYTVIDWWSAILDARENHHVSTSTFYLMQAIKNKYPNWNVPCYIYPRPNFDGLRGISQLIPDFNLIRV